MIAIGAYTIFIGVAIDDSDMFGRLWVRWFGRLLFLEGLAIVFWGCLTTGQA